MKTIVLLSSSNLAINLIKDKIRKQYTCIKKNKSPGHIDFFTKEEHIRVVFKKLNAKRPSDLSKYDKDTIFTYIDLYGGSEEFIANKLQNSLIKSREFINTKSIHEFLHFIKNQNLITYYVINESSLELEKLTSFKEPFCCSSEHLITNTIITDNYDEALKHRDKFIRQKISRIEKEIFDKSKEIESLKLKLSSTEKPIIR